MARDTWELILDKAMDGETNMAVDRALLDEVEQAQEPRTILRFYAWIRPTISLGRNQKMEKAVDVRFCQQEGLDLVYRPTGGRAVLHANEVTYAIASNDPSSFGGGSVYGTYRRISEALALGYERLGVRASLAPDTDRRPKSKTDLDDPCFVSPSRYELTLGGRKIVGSAQRRLRRSFLQHGSMPIRPDRELLARATRFENAPLLQEEMAGIAECMESPPDPETMMHVFVGAFGEHFGVAFMPRNGIGFAGTP